MLTQNFHLKMSKMFFFLTEYFSNSKSKSYCLIFMDQEQSYRIINQCWVNVLIVSSDDKVGLAIWLDPYRSQSYIMTTKQNASDSLTIHLQYPSNIMHSVNVNKIIYIRGHNYHLKVSKNNQETLKRTRLESLVYKLEMSTWYMQYHLLPPIGIIQQ